MTQQPLKVPVRSSSRSRERRQAEATLAAQQAELADVKAAILDSGGWDERCRKAESQVAAQQETLQQILRTAKGTATTAREPYRGSFEDIVRWAEATLKEQL